MIRRWFAKFVYRHTIGAAINIGHSLVFGNSHVKIKVKGFDAAMRNINRKVGNLDTKVLNAQLTLGAENWIQKNFQEQGRLAQPDTGWKELSPATLMRRRKHGAGAKILMDTGQLRSRWKRMWDDKQGVIQSGVPYAAKHHHGLEGLPVRRILPSKEQLSPIIKEISEVWLKEALK
jgi:phage gpG-like protein